MEAVRTLKPTRRVAATSRLRSSALCLRLAATASSMAAAYRSVSASELARLAAAAAGSASCWTRGDGCALPAPEPGKRGDGCDAAVVYGPDDQQSENGGLRESCWLHGQVASVQWRAACGAEHDVSTVESSIAVLKMADLPPVPEQVRTKLRHWPCMSKTQVPGGSSLLVRSPA